MGGLARRGSGGRIEGAALNCVLLSVLLSVVVVSPVFLRGMFVATRAPANGRATQVVKLQPSGSSDVARRHEPAAMGQHLRFSGGERIEGSAGCSSRNGAHSRDADSRRISGWAGACHHREGSSASVGPYRIHFVFLNRYLLQRREQRCIVCDLSLYGCLLLPPWPLRHIVSFTQTAFDTAPLTCTHSYFSAFPSFPACFSATARLSRGRLSSRPQPAYGPVRTTPACLTLYALSSLLRTWARTLPSLTSARPCRIYTVHCCDVGFVKRVGATHRTAQCAGLGTL